MRVARQHLAHRGQHRGSFGRVAVKHLVVDRHAIGRLHHAEHELPGHHAFLGHAEVTDITVELAQALAADGGEVVEHHREFVIDQGAKQVGHAVVDGALVVHQRVHAAQQVLVGDLRGIHAGHRDGLQPAQGPELGVGIAQAVEDHHANGLLHWGGVARTAENTCQGIKAQFAPELIQHPDIAQGQSGLELDLRGGHIARATLGAQQGREHCIELAAVLTDPAQRGDGTLAGLAGGVAKGLDQLPVGVAARAGELDEHGEAQCRASQNPCQHQQNQTFPLQKFRKMVRKSLIHRDRHPRNGRNWAQTVELRRLGSGGARLPRALKRLRLGI
jgi:hypothetical protein